MKKCKWQQVQPASEICDKMPQRIKHLDIAKGIGILLVILGHCQLGGISGVHSLIYSFHMPLFFFISGMCFSNKYSFATLAVKRFSQMILPTIYFSIISTLIVKGLGWHVGWWDWSRHFPFALWFLPVLYFAELLAWGICNKLHRFYLILSLFVMTLSPHLLTKYSMELPYSIAAIPVATLFYIIGYKSKKYILKINTHLLEFTLLMALFTVVGVRYWHVSMELASGQISPFVVAEIFGFSGLLTCLLFSKFLIIKGGGTMKGFQYSLFGSVRIVYV